MEKRPLTWWAMRGLWQGVAAAVGLVVLAIVVAVVRSVLG